MSSHPADREILSLRRLRDLSHKLVTETELSRLLPMILDAAIELQNTEIEPGGKRVLVVFDQKVEARGDRGIVSGPAAKMTATLISLDARSWQISSILPKR